MQISQWQRLVIILFILSVPNVRASNNQQKLTNNPSKSKNKESTDDTASYRLPMDIVPSEYFIHLTPHVEPSNFTFDGTVKIISKVKKTTSKIVLHVNKLRISRLKVFSKTKFVRLFKKNTDGHSMKTLEVLEVTVRKNYQFLIIRLRKPIIAGTSVHIEIVYNGKINEDMNALFRNWYKAEDGSIKWIFASHLQPTSARRVFPCFDEPALKAVFHVSIDVPKNCTALGNMPIKSAKNGLVKFEKTPPMSTYLVAVAFGDFAGVSTRAKNVSYTVWSVRPVSSQLSFALSVVPSVVDYMESHLKVPYGLGKLDLLAVTDYAHKGMENWGLIIENQILTTYDPAHTSLSDQKSVRNLIAHEVSHQWFGNLVTLRWWDCLWLNEAFASYFEYHAHDDRFTSWNLESDFVVSYMEDGFGFDAYNNSHPLTNPVYTNSEIYSMFDYASYKKGASLVRMLEKLLGSKIFYGALRRYLKKNKFSTGSPESLFASFEQEIKSNKYTLNMPIAKLMDSWTLQAGYPVIDAEFKDGSVTLKQSRFFMRIAGNWSDETLWVIPINWVTRSEPNFNATNKVTWLTEKSTVIHIGHKQSDWVIFNIQKIGFYRVNYDKKMWQRITEVLKSNELEMIHELNRASLIDDLFNLGRSGLLDYDIVLTASQYLTEETNYFPWRSAFSGLIYLKKRFTGHSEVMHYFKNYIRTLAGKNYNKLGFYEKEGDSDLNIFLRELILKMLCRMEHEGCIRNSLNTFKKMLSNDSFTVPPNIQSVVYCTAIKHGPPEYWKVLAEKYKKSNYASERESILYGFSCTKNSANLERLLLKMISFQSLIRKEDTKTMVASIAENSAVGVQTLLNFFESNSDKVVNYFSGTITFSTICGSIVEVLSTEELVSKFKKFVENIGEKTSIDQSLVETAEIELKWYHINAPKIVRWLKKNYPK